MYVPLKCERNSNCITRKEIVSEFHSTSSSQIEGTNNANTFKVGAYSAPGVLFSGECLLYRYQESLCI